MTKFEMKRYSRMSSNSLCLIPRKVIAWIILSMAVMTMISLMLIEVRRILAIRNLHRKKPFQNYAESVLNVYSNATNLSSAGLESLIQTSESQTEEVTRLHLATASWNDDVVQALFEDYPQCLERPYLLILVASAPENFERREAIRKSWANVERWKLQVSGLKSKTVFLVGKSPTKFLNILLKNENDIAGDILFGDYLDTYRNLTLKVMHGFSWAVRNCQSNFLLKTDDDCFVNVPLLVQFLWRFNPVPVNLYAGRVRWSAPVVRDPTNRWYVSSLEYPNLRYAPYVNGAGYVLSKDVLKRLVIFSDRVHFFPNEDAYVGTVLNAVGVRPTYSARFVYHSGPWQVCNFLYLFVVHRVKASLQSEHQDMANRAMDLCSTENIVKDWV